MSTGRLCGNCFKDIVIACPCRTARRTASVPVPPLQVISAHPIKRPRDEPVTSTLSNRSPPPSGVVGTNQQIEKSYVRPSTAPNSRDVRPEAVLRRAFAMCLAKPREEVEYAADQLKSIRQDLTVQQVESPFSAAVYEFHTRIAVVANHLPELGQCLNHVRSLHAKGIIGPQEEYSAICAVEEIKPPHNCDAKVEFAAYRILYSGLMGKHDDDVATEVARLDSSIWTHPFVSHAIKVVTNKHNGVMFRQLLHSAPSALYQRLMTLFLPKLRLEWIRTVVMGHHDFIPEATLVSYLALETVHEARSLFAPVLGSLWKQGLNGRDCRVRLITFVDELTNQRSS